MLEYVHVHSDYSNALLGFRDCNHKIVDLVAKHKELGCSSVMLTDHGGMSGHVALEKACKKAGLKAIFGNEIYLAKDGMSDTTYEKGDRFNHFVLIAKNRKGWEQLNRLVTKAEENSFTRNIKRNPNTLTHLVESIGTYGQNLIGTTACLGGLLHPYIQEWHNTRNEETKDKIIHMITFLNELFGQGNFFLEVQPALYEEQLIYNSWLAVFGRELGVPLIVGVDAHYLTKDDFKMHRAFLNSQDGKERETEDFYKYTYLMSEEEVRENFQASTGMTAEDIDNAIHNTTVVADMCEDYSISSPIVVPTVTVPPKNTWENIAHQYADIPFFAKFIESDNINDNYFVEQVAVGMNKYVLQGVLDKAEACERINTELEVIWDVSININDKLSSYFVTMQKILEIIWEISLIGAGRGSAGGFLTNFVLDITQVNPLDYDLPYWRFLHQTRPELPDIDIDSSSVRKDDILALLTEEFAKMGKTVAKVASFGTEKSKSAINTACAGLGYEPEEGLYLASLIPIDRGEPRGLQESYNTVPAFYKAMQNYLDVWEVAQSVEGLISSMGQHAAAVVFLDDDKLHNTTSLLKTKKGAMCIAYNLADADYLGMVKFDLLSTDAIDSIQTTMLLLVEHDYMEWQGNLKDTYDKYLHPSVINYTDQAMWKMVHDKEVLNLFQWATPQGEQGIDIAKPTSVAEFAVLNSVIRLMGSDEHPELPLITFGKYKNNPQLWQMNMDKYELTKEEQGIIRKHLSHSYGICAEQEQIMEMTMEKDIFDMRMANMTRKAIAKIWRSN